MLEIVTELMGTSSFRPIYEKLAELADCQGGWWASVTVRAKWTSVGRTDDTQIKRGWRWARLCMK